MRSTLFFGEGHLTVIDHAYIDEAGDIIGGSIAPSFTVTGDIEENEQVVIDFSKCKKRIKEIIDDKTHGIDHKLIVGDFSNITAQTTLPNGHVRIETPKWVIEGPQNMFHVCDLESYEDYLEAYIGDFVSEHLQEELPGVIVQAMGGFKPVIMPWHHSYSMFRYTHGLKSSSSWGCQNIAHGHLSYITIEADNYPAAAVLQQKIAADLDNTMFVYNENLDVGNVISYTTERGNFKLSPKLRSHCETFGKLDVLKTETTIENLVSYVANRYIAELRAVKANAIYISEGLAKGAMIEIGSLKGESNL